MTNPNHPKHFATDDKALMAVRNFATRPHPDECWYNRIDALAAGRMGYMDVGRLAVWGNELLAKGLGYREVAPVLSYAQLVGAGRRPDAKIPYDVTMDLPTEQPG